MMPQTDLIRSCPHKCEEECGLIKAVTDGKPEDVAQYPECPVSTDDVIVAAMLATTDEP